MASWASYFFGPGTLPPPQQQSGQPKPPSPYPQTHEQWVSRYSWLSDSYTGEAYSVGDMKALGLFRALDPDGEVILETRRLTRDVQHVVNTGAGALWGPVATLDWQPGQRQATRRGPDRLEAAARVWRRSRVQERKGTWATWGASMGDVVIEAVRQNATRPYDSVLVAYDPRSCQIDYDDLTGTRIERIVIRLPTFEPDPVTPRGTVAGLSPVHEYVRILTRDGVQVFLDGVEVAEETGDHGLGEVPAVHLGWLPYIDPSHSLWTAPNLEQPLAMVDSLLTQVQAIGGRHANPLLAGIGLKIPAGSDILQFGRVVSGVPQGGDVKYVEANMQGVATLLEAATLARQQARDTLPEFLFSQAGAGASGAALRTWGSAFVSKIENIRARWSPGLARVTQFAALLDEGAAYDPDDEWFQVLAPPALPVDVGSEVDTLEKVMDRGGLKLVDYVRHLQRLGLVNSEVEPEAYAAELEDEREATEARTQRTAAAVFGPARGAEPAAARVADDEGAGEDGPMDQSPGDGEGQPGQPDAPPPTP